MTDRAPTRRERNRERTLAEIKAIALRQIAEGGFAALSLNAIAKEMGVSGPALYRYFAARDDLLANLVVDAYEGLADALEAAPRAVRSLAGAYRDWALANPHRYRLALATPIGSGHLAPERVIPAAQRSMDVFLAALADLPPGPPPPAPLAAQLRAWGGTDLPPAVLHRGLTCWSRLHGLVMLELDGHLTATGIDPALLYRAEVDALI
jgi:AcrR family transcriptional regulator